MQESIRMRRIGALCLLALLAVALGSFSRAQGGMLPGASATTTSSSVLYSHSAFVQGSAATVMTINVPEAGELLMTLTDLDFPLPFASIDFGLTGASSALMGLSAPGTITLDLTKPTTLYAEVFATTQSSMDLGLYNFNATLLTAAPVPLPATGLLLSLALLIWVAATLAAGTRGGSWSVRLSPCP